MSTNDIIVATLKAIGEQTAVKWQKMKPSADLQKDLVILSSSFTHLAISLRKISEASSPKQGDINKPGTLVRDVCSIMLKDCKDPGSSLKGDDLDAAIKGAQSARATG